MVFRTGLILAVSIGFMQAIYIHHKSNQAHNRQCKKFDTMIEQAARINNQLQHMKILSR